MLSLGTRQKDQRANLFQRAIIVAACGTLVSLFLEVSQCYFVSGRHSSLFDWITNTFGTLLGITFFLCEQELWGTTTEHGLPTNAGHGSNKEVPQ